MADAANQVLQKIGHDAVATVPELGEATEVEVRDILDSSDEPAYLFSFLLDRADERPSIAAGRAYIRLVQALRNALMDRGEEGFPQVQLFTKDDWEQRRRA